MADLFGGPFQGLLAATATIEELRRIPDATVEQAERSNSLFAEFEESQAPYKKALDIWVSRHFGNERAQEYLTLAGPDLVEQISSAGSGLSPEYREAIAKGTDIGRETRFFHWDLEFPEAFVDLQGGRWKPKEEQGFDAVVGNPPYDVLSTKELGYDVSLLVGYVKVNATYDPAVRGKLNLYKLFICRAHVLARRCSFFSFVVPMALLGDDQSKEVRQLILTGRELKAVESFPQKDDPNKRVFREAKLSTTVFVASGTYSGEAFCVRTHPGGQLDEQSPVLKLRPEQVSLYDPENMAIPSCTQRDWNLAIRMLSNHTTRMSDVAGHNQGEVNETIHRRFLFEGGDGPTVLRGAAISMYAVRQASQGKTLKLDTEEFLKGTLRTSKAWDHQHRRVGFQRSSPQNNFRRLIASPILQGEFCFDTVSYVTDSSSKISLDLLILLLNSKILDWYFRLGSTNSKVNEYQFNNLPVVQTPDYVSDTPWGALIAERRWDQLEASLLDECSEPGFLPGPVAVAFVTMCREIQRIEASRTLKNRSDRSHLAPESQTIQDVIDRVLFRCYGLSDDDARYVEKRLREML